MHYTETVQINIQDTHKGVAKFLAMLAWPKDRLDRNALEADIRALYAPEDESLPIKTIRAALKKADLRLYSPFR